MMYRTKRKKIFLVLTLLIMAFIFYMSSCTGDESGGLSLKVSYLVCKVLVPGFTSMSEAEQVSRVEGIHLVIRKLAHFTEYFALGVSLAGTVYPLKRSTAMGIGILYACSDEIHQLFVDGRSGNVVDVCIDSCGVIAGVVIMWCILRKTEGDPDGKLYT